MKSSCKHATNAPGGLNHFGPELDHKESGFICSGVLPNKQKGNPVGPDLNLVYVSRQKTGGKINPMDARNPVKNYP